MSFIVIEGLDGSGKSTQIKLIQDYFAKQNIAYKFLHFPRVDSPVFGELISMFLRGELGDLNTVNPYLVALMYACDRKDAASTIQQWLDEDYLVLVDRYVYSNIGYQCAKVDNVTDREKLANWIKNLEYNHYKLPQPDINIFLEVPFNFTKNKLQNNRMGDDRDYLKGKTDIHEADLTFQQKVKDVYLWQEKVSPELKRLSCADNERNMLSVESIHQNIIKTIEPYLK